MERIRSNIVRHVLPPVQLGQGPKRSTLALKYQAVLHAMSLVSQDWHTLQGLLRSIPTWLSDMGTEFGIAKIKAMPLSEIFPWASHGRDDAGVAEVDFASDLHAHLGDVVPEGVHDACCMPGGVHVADVSRSVQVPGLLHILDNATSDFANVLPDYGKVVGKMRKVAALVRRPDSRDRLLELCFSSGAGAGFRADLSSGARELSPPAITTHYPSHHHSPPPPSMVGGGCSPARAETHAAATGQPDLRRRPEAIQRGGL